MILKISILNLKILFGYFIILIVIGNVVFIIVQGKQRLYEIETDAADNRNIRYDINTVHRFITELATFGESVINWEDIDYQTYHEKRLCIDSLLQKLRQQCSDFILPEQIDTLRSVLTDKEQHLFHIMQTLHKQEKADSLLMHCLPIVAKQVVNHHEITRKKKGIAGWLGGKETIQVPAPTKTFYELSEQLIEMQEERRHDLESYTDTLRARNRRLNIELVNLISQMDGLAQTAFRQKEQRIDDMRQNSFRLMSYVLGVAIVLLLLSYLIIQRDLRQKEKSRRALEESIRQNKALLEMRKKIILTISHDIRGPLGSINGSAELAMDTRDRRKRNNLLENIQASCRHILHLTNNLLDIYRMNGRKESKNEVPFRLGRLIGRITSEYSRKSNDKGILFTTELSGLETTVKGDADRIEQILDNLLVNAIKFTEAGEICLSAGYVDGQLAVEVSDTGIGMSDETQARIFEPFERAAQETNSEGFGLGLSITKGLVGLLDGEITVESSVGKGSTFRVVLPLEPSEEQEEKDSADATGTMRLPRQVIAVDDDALQLEVIKEMLERNGVACITCSRAKEVVQALRTQDADLILTDIQMPGTNGFELLKLLRNSHIGNSRTIPVMAMTARGDRGTCNFMEAGFSGCISKPFSSKELLAFISSAVPQENGEGSTASLKGLISETADGRKILGLFIEEAERSVQELQDALKNTDREKLRETVHRMSPVWELLQADQPLQAYRRTLHDENADERIIREETEKIMAYTRELMVKAGKEIVNLEHGTEDTDC
ncbi:ATP-binding protein [Phocaeicola sp.]